MHETGPDRIRAAIERDWGMNAPEFPVRVCGPGCCGDAEQGPEFAKATQHTDRRYRVGRMICWLICPGCLGFRLSLGHLSRKLLIGGCSMLT